MVAQEACQVFKISDIVRENISLSVTIKGMARFKIRIAIASLIFRFGGWVAGMNVTIK
jgi:hypothetical protein